MRIELFFVVFIILGIFFGEMEARLNVMNTVILWATSRNTVESAPFTITLDPEEPPKFKRTYRAKLPNHATLTITMYTSSIIGRTDRFGELTQWNGKWILYDVHAVADKIIDRELYPLVQNLTDQALVLDRQFVQNLPKEFMDETQTIWKRD